MLFGAHAQNVRFVYVWTFGLKFVYRKLIFECRVRDGITRSLLHWETAAALRLRLSSLRTQVRGDRFAPRSDASLVECVC